MKKFYMAPDAEITRFVAEENLTASGGEVYVDVDAWGQEGNPDGDVNK